MNQPFSRRKSNEEYMLRLFDNRRKIILTVLPPLLLGLGSVLAILSNQLVVSVTVWIFLALIISTGGVISLIRGMPAWGDTWLGSLLILVILLIRLLMEEGKQADAAVLSPIMSNVITVIVALALLGLIFVIALKGWQRTGLVGIGLSSTLGIGIWNTFARPPFNQEILSLSVAPIGMIMAVCVYLYVRKSDTVKILSIMSIWLICLSTALVSNFVYQGWFSERGRAFPLFSLMAILSLLLWVGPFMAMMISALRRMTKHLIFNKNV
jgi:hypothetical protein